MKIKFESDDDLPLLLGKALNILSIKIVTRSVFQKYNKCYPQVYLRECGYEFVNKL